MHPTEAMNADGRLVAFTSFIDTVVAGDTNRCSDVFVVDTLSGMTERVSVSSLRGQGANNSGGAALSADGRYVVFESSANNLIWDDANIGRDIFVRDRLLDTTECVSRASSGGQALDTCYSPSLSADGAVVAFASLATNLVPDDTNIAPDVFARDLVSGVTERVSSSAGNGPSNGLSDSPSVSGDGRYVAFRSVASNLVAGDANGQDDIFVRDRQLGLTTRVSVSAAGSEANNFSFGPRISADGRFVAFVSAASNLEPGDGNQRLDVFVKDLSTGAIERISRPSGAGGQANNDSANPVISAEGRFVAFSSRASDLDGSSQFEQVFVRDRLLSSIQRVTRSSNGSPGNGDSLPDGISPDGQFVTFATAASNLAGGVVHQRANLRRVARAPFSVNTAPSANAGLDQSVAGLGSGTGVILDGSASSDPESNPLFHSWELDDQRVAHGPRPLVQLPPGDHPLIHRVQDIHGAMDSDYCFVTVGVVDFTRNLQFEAVGRPKALGGKQFRVRVRVTNPFDRSVPGPLSLVLTSLPAGAKITNAAGVTSLATGDPGKPYVQMIQSIAAGGSRNFDLIFRANRAPVIDPESLRMLAGSGPR